jgi:cytochrome c biogenesis protein CcdA
MKSFLTAVALVIVVIFVLKVVAVVSALVLAVIPAAVALLSGVAVGYRLGKHQERRRLQARTAPRLP